jgi:hypothetical protein
MSFMSIQNTSFHDRERLLAVHSQDHSQDHLNVAKSEHPSVADSKYNIAGLHEEQGQVEEAKKLFLECEQIYAKVHGQDHSDTLDAARRAQNVGLESGDDGEEEEEGEEEDELQE